jgi:hypothetical protein
VIHRRDGSPSSVGIVILDHPACSVVIIIVESTSYEIPHCVICFYLGVTYSLKEPCINSILLGVLVGCWL